MTAVRAPAPERIATYRLQFTPQFRFREALAVLPYLRGLGISHVYASPITRARAGSTHGYDVCDPRAVNPELGTRAELLELLRAARAQGLGWLQDVVPNHLAVSAQNPFLWDVLAFGRRSRWGFLFDIDWEHLDLGGKVLLPQLGEPYVDSLRAGRLRLRWQDRGPVLVYGGLELPLAGASVAALLDASGLAPEVSQALAESDGLIPAEERERLRAEALEMAAEPALRARLDQVLARVTDPLDIDAVVVQQAWQLAWWRMGRELVGYRRFFAVDELIAVRMEDPRTFELMHALAFELVDSGLVDGLRIDHVDGLVDPTAYLRGLRARLPGAWLVVEKILGRDEELPAQWPIDGTTGYELLARMTAACCAPSAQARFDALHHRLTGSHREPARLAGDLRRDVDALGLGGDLDRVVRELRAAACATLPLRDCGRGSLRRGLAALLAGLPVYRTYTGPDDPPQVARATLAGARDAAAREQPALAAVVTGLHDVLATGIAPDAPAVVRAALLRVQQLSGAVMAKGCEDTFFYAWTRLLALNEVGGDPLAFGMPSAAFLAGALARGARWPGTINASATHDTKRGEDVRARLAALSWLPERWDAFASAWMADHERWAVHLAGGPAPAREDRHLLYQTLVGTWPEDGAVDAAYGERIQACALKSAREAGQRTRWSEPDAAYEEALRQWVAALLDPGISAAFHADLGKLVAALAPRAHAISAAQVVLKCTLPGVPDVYQGTELGDFALVDPDNRRPVDFALAQRVLAGQSGGPAPALPGKLDLLARCLRLRRADPALWCHGRARALETASPLPQGVMAFTRESADAVALVVVAVADPLSLSSTVLPRDEAWPDLAWSDAMTGRIQGLHRLDSLATVLGGATYAVLIGRRQHAAAAIVPVPGEMTPQSAV